MEWEMNEWGGGEITNEKSWPALGCSLTRCSEYFAQLYVPVVMLRYVVLYVLDLSVDIKAATHGQTLTADNDGHYF